MQEDEKNAGEAVAAESRDKQSALAVAPTPPYNNRLATILLILSGLGLWGSTAAVGGSLLFGGRGDAAIGKLFDLLVVAGPAAVGGVVLLALYTVIQQPWRAGRGSLAFILQIPFALFAILIATAIGFNL